MRVTRKANNRQSLKMIPVTRKIPVRRWDPEAKRMVTLTKPKRKATNQEIMQHSLLHKGKIQLNVSLRIRDYSVSVLAGWTGSSSIIKYVYSIPEALTFEKELRKLCEGK